MRTDRWRYVEWVNPRREIIARELYDELNDPQENENVFDRAENRATRAALEAELRARRGPPDFGR